MVRKVLISEELERYIVRLVRMTRTGQAEAHEMIGKWVSWGAGSKTSSGSWATWKRRGRSPTC